MTALPRLILASGSPRRSSLLRGLGLTSTTRPVDIDETPGTGEEPAAYVLRLAREKAMAETHAGELILAADTIVVLDGAILGKPRDPADARRMLHSLAGREHTVLTAVALHEPDTGRTETASVSTVVRIAEMSPEELAWYVDTGEPLDKAGSYAVQGLGSLFVDEVRGNYSNVVGLPIPTVFRLFAELGYDLRDFRG